jgi:SAM-dependent methyltransferase
MASMNTANSEKIVSDGRSMAQEPLEELQRLIDAYIATKDTVRLLEAGCGSMSKVRLGHKVLATGIDISAAQLLRNSNLNEKILGDIQTYQLEKNSFDMIICWDVLEHLNSPQLALEKFFHAIKPGGLIILAYPNLFSLKGFITKVTPHIVHVWYYRYLLHRPNAGKDDTAPFVTQLRLASTYPAIRRQANSNRAQEVFFALRESFSMQYVRKNFPPFNVAMKTASLVSRTLSLGKLDVIQSDCIQVFQASPET